VTIVDLTGIAAEDIAIAGLFSGMLKARDGSSELVSQ